MKRYKKYPIKLIFLLFLITISLSSCSQSPTKECKIDLSESEIWINKCQITQLDSIQREWTTDSLFFRDNTYKVVSGDTLWHFIKYPQRKVKLEVPPPKYAPPPPPPPIVYQIDEVRSSSPNKSKKSTMLKRMPKAVMADDMADVTDAIVDIPRPIIIEENQVLPQPIIVEETQSVPPPQVKDKSSKIVSPLETPITLEVSDIKMDSMVSPKVDNIEIKFGTLVYYIPDTMIKKKTYTIRLRINRDTTDRSIFVVENVAEKIESTIIKTTSKMEILIVDPSPPENKSFEIVKSNDDKQIVDDDSYTEWIYNITPLRSGNLKLNIIISIVRDNNKKQVVYFKDIRVKSNPGADVIDFIKKYWQWMITTLIIPLVVWWWKNRKKKRVGRPKKS